MTFLQPWMLWGLLAASVPIIIHLIHRSRPRRQPFAAIELLLASAKRVDRRWRLQRILLLASRVALLALLALAAARPAPVRTEAATAPTGPRRVGVVIDASASMQARYAGERAFDRAVEKAQILIDDLGPEDLAVIVRAGPEATLATPEPTADRRALRSALDRLEPSHGRCDLGRATTLAVRALDPGEEGAEAAVEVVVLSDWTDSALQTAADGSLASGGQARIDLVDAIGDARDGAVENVALTSVRAEPAPGAPAMSLQFFVRSRSFGESGGPSRPVPLDLIQAGEPLESTMTEVAPGTISDRVLEHTFESAGTQLLTLRAAPDRMELDDHFHLVAEVRRRVRTLVVDGDPSGVAKEDEVFYLDKAAKAGLTDHPVPRIVTADELTGVDLSGFDVVVLAGLVSLSGSEAEKLAGHVESGGGLLLTMSEATSPATFNASLDEVLPRRLRGLGRLADVAGSTGPVAFETPDLEHPIFAVFRGEGLSGLASTRTHGFMLLEPGRDRAARVPLRFSNGHPAMVTAQVGEGRVALWTSSIDRDLTDFPIQPAFVPWVRRTILWLGRSLFETDDRRTQVGEVRVLRVPPGLDFVEVETPGADRVSVPVTGSVASFSETSLPGHYRVFARDGRELSDEHFAVNVDRAESDLRPLALEEAEVLLVGGSEEAARATQIRELGADDTWTPQMWSTLLLALMALAFLLESLLTARRIGRA